MDSKLPLGQTVPLAERMRPSTLEDFFGQDQLLADGKMLRELLRSGSVPSIILWGPPGTGKTSLARVISSYTGAFFVFFSAVLSGVKEIRKIVHDARERAAIDKTQTILFVDEIHRFNKSQQDAFLPHVENGLFTLIGATTENPSFQVIAPLLSRCRVLVLEPLSAADIGNIILRALHDHTSGLGSHHLKIGQETMDHLVDFSDGDARRALNILELAATLVLQRSADSRENLDICLTDIEEATQKKTLRYDKTGEEHYNLISALHKSLRDSDPDGSLYWFYRMLDAGEDPLYLSRRLVRFASEDIGVADPHALVQANASREAYQALGSPEGDLSLAQTVIYLATAPKSNAVYSAAKEVRALISKSGSLPVPLHIRNAPTALMKKLGYNKGYQYAHDDKDALVSQTHLPERLEGNFFYHPTNRGYESVIKQRLEKWRALLEKKEK